MRHAATRALLERGDVIIVASVSCIYGIGAVETYAEMVATLETGGRVDRAYAAQTPGRTAIPAQRCSISVRGAFRVRGDVVEIFPSHLEDRAWRLSLFGDEVEAIWEIDPLTGEKTRSALESITVYANSHYVTPRPTLQQAFPQHQGGAEERRVTEFTAQGKLLEAQRLQERTTFDLEMMETTGSLCRHRELFALPHRPRNRGNRRRPCSNTYPKTPF